MKEKIKKAFLPSAGLGKRLRPLTENLPKALVEVQRRPLITYALQHLIGLGVEEVMISTHHAADSWKSVFPQSRWKNLKLNFCYEPTLLETGGGLKNVEYFFKDVENFIVYNSDIVTNIPIQKAINFHVNRQAQATLVLRSSGGPLQVQLNQDFTLKDIQVSPQTRDTKYLFTGIQILNRKIFDAIKTAEFASIIKYYRLIIEERRIYGVVIDDGAWTDIGTLNEYHRIQNLSPQNFLVYLLGETITSIEQ